MPFLLSAVHVMNYIKACQELAVPMETATSEYKSPYLCLAVRESWKEKTFFSCSVSAITPILC